MSRFSKYNQPKRRSGRRMTKTQMEQREQMLDLVCRQATRCSYEDQKSVGGIITAYHATINPVQK
jgi:hypothetical protein